MLDFECSPVAFLQQSRRLALYRQILHSHNASLKSFKSEKFLASRRKFCEIFSELLREKKLKESSPTAIACGLDKHNLIELDLKEMFMRAIFY